MSRSHSSFLSLRSEQSCLPRRSVGLYASAGPVCIFFVIVGRLLQAGNRLVWIGLAVAGIGSVVTVGAWSLQSGNGSGTSRPKIVLRQKSSSDPSNLRVASEPFSGITRPSSLRRSTALALPILIGIACGWRSYAEEHAIVSAKESVATLFYRRVEAWGEVVSEPKRLWGADTFTLRVTELRADDVVLQQQLRVLTTDKGLVGARLGETIRIVGIVAPLPSSRSSYYDRIHTVAALRAEHVEIRGPPRRLIAASNWVRDRLSMAVYYSLPRTESALMLGLLIGEDTRLPPEVKDAFRNAGMSHLTAVSGQNFAVVLGMVAFATNLLVGRGNPTGRESGRTWGKVVILSGVTLFFAVLTRWEPSVMRAALMMLLGLFWVWRRKPSSLEVLSLSVALLLFLDPFLLDSAGFQLSVAATAGILVFGLRWAEWAKMQMLATLGRRGFDPIAAKVISAVPAPAAICFAAQTFVWPVLFWRFGEVQLAGVFSNLLAVPLAELASLYGFALAIPALAFPRVVGKAYIAVGPSLSLIARTAEGFSRFPKLEVTIPQTWRGIIAVAFFVSIAACLRLRSMRFWARFGRAIRKDQLLYEGKHDRIDG
ncbi:MAG: hypothetical protein C4318_02855 [Acidimicrobiia bacterium]